MTTHEHETLAPAAACASVALDVGTGRGALVLYPSERFRGREIEISRGDGSRVHTGVHDRSTDCGWCLTAIFGSLPAGEYVVWEDRTTPGPRVTVTEAAVTEVSIA